MKLLPPINNTNRKNTILVLLAGHETTAGAVSWALLNLARNQEIQDRLRNEIRAAFPGGTKDMTDADQLDALKFLNNVLRETLRHSSPSTYLIKISFYLNKSEANLYLKFL